MMRFGDYAAKSGCDIRKMACVLLEDDPALFIQNHHFDGRGTYIDSNPQNVTHTDHSYLHYLSIKCYNRWKYQHRMKQYLKYFEII